MTAPNYTKYAENVAEHEFLIRMIPTVLAELRLEGVQEPYAHPDYAKHCAKIRGLRVRIVTAEMRRKEFA